MLYGRKEIGAYLQGPQLLTAKRKKADLFNRLAGTACGTMLQTRRATIYYVVSEKPNFVTLLIHA